MSMQEALATGLETTVVGLSIVFSVLIILMLVLKLFEKIFYKPEQKQAEKPQSTEPKTVESVNGEADEEELIAVLTAAIAASLNTTTYNLKIKSYRRIDNNTPAWNRAGVRETIENRIN